MIMVVPGVSLRVQLLLVFTCWRAVKTTLAVAVAIADISLISSGASSMTIVSASSSLFFALGIG